MENIYSANVLGPPSHDFRKLNPSASRRASSLGSTSQGKCARTAPSTNICPSIGQRNGRKSSGSVILARTASATRSIGYVLALQTTVLWRVKSLTTKCNPLISQSRLDDAPLSSISNNRSISPVSRAPSSSPHVFMIPNRFVTSISRNLVKSASHSALFTRDGDLPIASILANSAPALVPQYSLTRASRPPRSISTSACIYTRHRVPPPANTSRAG
jgi:hypothetical protein